MDTIQYSCFFAIQLSPRHRSCGSGRRDSPSPPCPLQILSFPNQGLQISGINTDDSLASDLEYPSSASSTVFPNDSAHGSAPITPDTSLEDEIDKVDHGNEKTPTLPTPLEHAIESAIIGEEPTSDSTIADDIATPTFTTTSTTSPSVQAVELFEGRADFASHAEGAAWLGDSGEDRAQVRREYMRLFDWTDKSILASMRGLCDKLYMKGESQQLDRVLDAFSDRWVECNPQHGFKSVGVVYTLAYSILLLNTDHYSEEYSGNNKRMAKSRYVKQTLDAIKNLLQAEELEKNTSESADERTRQDSVDSLSGRPTSALKRRSTLRFDNHTLVCDNTVYSPKEWETHINNLLKAIYISIDLTPLNLAPENSKNSGPYGNRNFSQSAASIHSARNALDNLSLFSRFSLVRRSSWIGNDAWSDYEYQGFVANNSAPTLSQRRSLYGITGESGSSVGFSGVLRNTLIREERSHSVLAANAGARDVSVDNSDTISVTTSIAASMVRTGGLAKEDELALAGAPWAKEGLLKFQSCSQAGVNKKYKKRDWSQVFVVVQKGYLKVFRFDIPSKQRPATFAQRNSTGDDVGGGNWLDKATMTENISLCHCVAQLNHAKKDADKHYRPAASINASQEDSCEWSLTLPTHGLFLFRAGTREIAEEFVYTCNYWAALASKEPLVESISSAEYGWNRPIEILKEKQTADPNYRPRVSSGSFDVIFIDGQRIQVKEWKPPASSVVHSALDEEQQLESLKHYIATVQESLIRHSDYLAPMLRVFQPGHLVSTRAHSNWEKRSQYFLKETVKYEVYVSTLERALKDKQETHIFDE